MKELGNKHISLLLRMINIEIKKKFLNFIKFSNNKIIIKLGAIFLFELYKIEMELIFMKMKKNKIKMIKSGEI